MFKENNILLKKIFFSRLISLRPTILDDEDYIEFKEIVKRKKYDTISVIMGFMSLNAWTFYAVSIKKQKFLGKFLLANTL